MTAFKGLGTYGNAVGVVTPGDHKQDNAGLVVKSTGNLARAGVFWGGTASIVSGTANMTYNVAAYTIATTRGATSGVVFGGNDGVLNVATTAAPGSNSRIDVVYHWQREFSIDGVDSNPVIGVVQGTAAASPTVPSLSAFPGAVALAQILVPAGVTATNTGTTFTHVAPFTAAAGGTVVFRTTTERDASTVVQGTKCYVIGDSEYIYNGTAWISAAGGLVPLIPSSVVGGTVSGVGAVTFTASSGIALNGVFTSAYDNFLVILDVPTHSTGSVTQFRLRVGGVDDSTASAYQNQVQTNTVSTASTAQSVGTVGLHAGSGASTEDAIKTTFFAPALARVTRWQSEYFSVVSSIVAGSTYGRHTQAVAYDGLDIIPSTGTITGTVHVYGYVK